jgi:hypothetical protein
VAKRIEVQIVGDASSLRNALNQAQGSTSKFGSALGTLAKTGALAAGAAGIGAVALTLRQGIKEYTESAKVAAQTNAVLKSTGQAANVTAREISGLATSLMKKSGVDDEAIQSGENLLLTFTRIRNEAGKGNDIFNQATKATLDLSVAMGKDMSSSAILVGKALNDPVKGMTALTKAGVQFTDSQKETIKKMVETGDVMGAQKLILEELTKQFGGSAEAVGKTLPGQLNILKESFNNFAGDLVSKAMPAVQRFVDFLNTRLIPAEGFTATLKVAWEGVSEVAVDLWGQLRTAVMGGEERLFIPADKRIEIIEVEGLASKLKTKIMESIAAIDWSEVLLAVAIGIGKGVIRLQQEIWKFLFNAWVSAWGMILTKVQTEAGQLVDRIITGIAALPGRLRTTLGNAMTTGLGAITAKLGEAFTAASNLGSRIVAGVGSGLVTLREKVEGKLGAIRSAIVGVAGDAVGWAASIGSGIISGVISGLSGLFSAVVSAITGPVRRGISWARGHLGSTAEEYAAAQLGVPIAQGISTGAAAFINKNLAGNLSDVLRNAINSTPVDLSAATGGTDIATTMKAGMDEFLGTNLPDNLKQVLGLAFDEATSSMDFSQAGLGVSWTPTSTAPPIPSGPSGGPFATVGVAPVTVIIEAPIGSEQDLQNMVVSALAKVNGRGGIS